MRLFAAVVPAVAAQDHLAAALAAVAAPGGGRSPWLPQNNWHLTLAFYGEVPDGRVPSLSGEVAEAARALPPLAIELFGAGSFHHATAWIGAHVDETAWRRLTRALAPSRLGVGRGDGPPRNRPHLTVSRAGGAPGVAEAVQALAVYRGPCWTADEVVLFASALGQGVGGHPLYTPVATAPLAGTSGAHSA